MLFPTVLAASAPTFYFHTRNNYISNGCPTVQNANEFNVGACSAYNYRSSDPTYWAAINGGNGRCGQQITVTYQGKSMCLTIADECPGCGGDGHVDMSLDALVELTGSPEVACAVNLPMPQIDWSFGCNGGSSGGNSGGSSGGNSGGSGGHSGGSGGSGGHGNTETTTTPSWTRKSHAEPTPISWAAEPTTEVESTKTSSTRTRSSKKRKTASSTTSVETAVSETAPVETPLASTTATVQEQQTFESTSEPTEKPQWRGFDKQVLYGSNDLHQFESELLLQSSSASTLTMFSLVLVLMIAI